MQKLLLPLLCFVVAACGCAKQTPRADSRKAEAAASASQTPSLSATTLLNAAAQPNVTGSYDKAGGELDVLQLPDGRLKISLALTCCRDHEGVLCAVLPFAEGEAHYRKKSESTEKDEYNSGVCDIRFKFAAKRVVIKQEGSAGDCDFGAGIAADGTYAKRSNRPPKIDDADCADLTQTKPNEK